jgi:hypothetical protein
VRERRTRQLDDGRRRHPELDRAATDRRELHLAGVFAGTIDSVRVYNRALTQAQIQADMNAG